MHSRSSILPDPQASTTLPFSPLGGSRELAYARNRMPGRPITDFCRRTTGPAKLAARLSTPRPRVTFGELQTADLIRIEIGTRPLEESHPPTASVFRRE